MKILLKIGFLCILLGLFIVEVQSVVRADDDRRPITGPITSPITSPITGPALCKPGWGFGDKNHCHSGPPGLEKGDKDSHNDHEDSDHGNHGKNN